MQTVSAFRFLVDKQRSKSLAALLNISTWDANLQEIENAENPSTNGPGDMLLSLLS
jgi:hypothetical protein